MLRDGKVYIPRDKRLRAEVIQLYHDILVEGHRGQWKTTELVTSNFWWPGVTKEVKKYVESCDAYQRNKNCTEVPAGKLMFNAVLEKSWSYIMADFITKLPLAQGYDMILVAYDRMTKITHFVLTTEKTLVEEIARLFQNNIQKLHGLLESIVIDRGAQFVAGMMRELNQINSLLFTNKWPDRKNELETRTVLENAH